MSLGQRTANEINARFEEETEHSFAQRTFRNRPGLRMAAQMSKLPVMLGASLLPGGAAAAGILGATGLMTSASKTQENKKLLDYKRAEGASLNNPGKNNYYEYLRSPMNAIQSLAAPAMGLGATAQALSMYSDGALGKAAGEIAPNLIQGSMALRNPLMGLQFLSSHGLTHSMAGLGGQEAIKALGKTAGEGTLGLGNIAMGSAMLPSTLLYGAGGLLKGAGGLASMVGLGNAAAPALAGAAKAGGLGAGLTNTLGASGLGTGLTETLGAGAGLTGTLGAGGLSAGLNGTLGTGSLGAGLTGTLGAGAPASIGLTSALGAGAPAMAGTGLAGALGTGGGMVSGLGDSLLQLLSASGGAGSVLGPLLGMATTMALSKPVNKMMGAIREKATGSTMMNKGKKIRPLVQPSGPLAKRY